MEIDTAMHELVLYGYYKEIIGRYFGGAKVKMYRMIGSHSIRIDLRDEKTLVFAYHSPDEWAFGENTLYDPATSKRKGSAKKHDYGQTGSDVYASKYPCLSHQAIRERFKELFPKLAEETVSIAPNGSRSVSIVTASGQRMIFACYAPDKWSIGRTLADGDNMRRRSKSTEAFQED